jgi:hypothetical protein
MSDKPVFSQGMLTSVFKPPPPELRQHLTYQSLDQLQPELAMFYVSSDKPAGLKMLHKYLCTSCSHLVIKPQVKVN